MNLIKRFTALLQYLSLFLAVGCGHPKKDIYRLSGIENFTAEEQADILESIELLNNKLGRTVIALDGEGTEISLQKTAFDKSTRLGYATRFIVNCRVELSPKIFQSKGYVGSVVLHELGHCFGKDHDGDNGEIMSAKTMPLNFYSPDKIERFFHQISLSVKMQ